MYYKRRKSRPDKSVHLFLFRKCKKLALLKLSEAKLFFHLDTAFLLIPLSFYKEFKNLKIERERKKRKKEREREREKESERGRGD